MVISSPPDIRPRSPRARILAVYRRIRTPGGARAPIPGVCVCIRVRARARARVAAPIVTAIVPTSRARRVRFAVGGSSAA